MTNDDLIAKIEKFAELRGIACATVTSRAVGNSRLYARLKSGNSCTLDVAGRINDFIKKGENVIHAEVSGDESPLIQPSPPQKQRGGNPQAPEKAAS